MSKFTFLNFTKRNNSKILPLYITSFLLLVFSITAYSQNTLTVSGSVTDSSGLPIPGASVTIKDTQKGTTTDFNGKYTIEAPSNGTLVFRSIGSATQSISINGRTTIDVQLKEDTEQLEEIVVIGYGAQRKESVTGSVVSIKAEDLTEVQTANFQQAIQGRVAGVQISTTSTRSGATPQIRIRGTRSLTANNDPLIVLNGVPFSGGLNDINMNDIASLDILKDASATAVYGSRGANGVIIITTKSGKKGQKATFTYDGYYAAKQVFSKFDMMNAAQLTQLRADVASINDGSPIYPINNDEDLANDTDWQDLLYGTGLQTSHNISVKGGSEYGTYNVGVGYFKESSIAPGDDFQRYSLRAQIDQEIGAFRFGLNTVMNFNETNSTVGVGGVLSASPLLSPYDENGEFLENVRLQTDADDLWIPTRNEVERVLEEEGRVNQQYDFGVYNNLYAEVKFPWVEGLKYRLNVGVNIRTSRDGNFTGSGVFNYNATSNSSASYSSSITKDYVIENQLLFDRTFADKHQVNFVGLFSSQNTEYDNVNLSVQRIPNELSLWYNLDSALSEDITGYGTGYSATGLLSYMGRIMYQYDNRYLFTATLRSDGSSRLAPGHKWVTYPAVSAGWNIANEKFMEEVDYINQLKVKVGYGETSNQAVDAYSTQGRLSTHNYNFGSSTFATGYSVSGLPNPNLGWEFSETYNFGVDFSLFNNRLSGTAEYYITKTNDILYSLGLPATSGVGNVTSNIGKTENKGLDLSLNGVILDNPDGFTWDAGINLYTNRNKIIALATGEDENVGQNWFVGHPINVIYDHKYLGLWNESDPDYQYLQDYEPGGNVGMIKVAYTGEFNADGSPVRGINSEDRIIQDPTPDFQGGFNTRLAYKNFDLSMVGTFQKGGTVVSTLYSGHGYLNLLTGRRNNVVVDYWTPNNTGARFPAPGGLQSGDNQKYINTLGYFDGTFMKIRTITLGYNFDQGLIKDLGLQKLRLYATAQNPFVFFSDFNKKSGMDHETNSGVDSNGNRQNVAVNTSSVSKGIPTIGSNTPTTRNYMIGLNLTF